MSNPLIISIQLFIIILKLFTYTADTANITNDLEIICSFMVRTEIIKSTPPECTSLSIPTKNMDELKAISSIKGNLPLLLIDDTRNYYDWHESVKNGATDYLKDIKDLGVNYVVFANIYKSSYKMNEERDQFSKDLATFFDDAKKQYPDVGFGLMIPVFSKWVDESLDIRLLNDHVDFFILKSKSYRSCKHHNHQADMPVLATKDDIMDSFTKFKDLGVDMGKMIYQISLVVESEKSTIINVFREDMSYSRLCSKKMSKHRKYCFNTIQNLVEMARLHISEKTLGIYARGVDYDDVNGSCDCTTKDDSSAEFRGLKTIAGASREDKNDISYYDCAQGHFPVILH